MGADQLPDIGVHIKGRERTAAHLGLPKGRGYGREYDHGSQCTEDRDNDKAHSRPGIIMDPGRAISGLVDEGGHGCVHCDQQTDQDCQIEVDDHRQRQCRIVESDFVFPDQFFAAEGCQRKERYSIQPHDIPVVTGDKSAEAIKKSEDQD